MVRGLLFRFFARSFAACLQGSDSGDVGELGSGALGGVKVPVGSLGIRGAPGEPGRGVAVSPGTGSENGKPGMFGNRRGELPGMTNGSANAASSGSQDGSANEGVGIGAGAGSCGTETTGSGTG